MKRKCESLREFCKSERKMFSDKNKIDETSGLSFIVICDNKIILFYEQISILKLEKYSLPICSMYEVYKLNKLLQSMAAPLESFRSPVLYTLLGSLFISVFGSLSSSMVRPLLGSLLSIRVFHCHHPSLPIPFLAPTRTL